MQCYFFGNFIHTARKFLGQKEEECDDSGKDNVQEGEIHVNDEVEDSYNNIGESFPLQA